MTCKIRNWSRIILTPCTLFDCQLPLDIGKGSGSAFYVFQFAFGLWLLIDAMEIKGISWRLQNDPYKDPGYSYICTQVIMSKFRKEMGEMFTLNNIYLAYIYFTKTLHCFKFWKNKNIMWIHILLELSQKGVSPPPPSHFLLVEWVTVSMI